MKSEIDNRFVVSKIIDKYFDNPVEFDNWLNFNFNTLKEDAQKELIEAHSEGIKFMAEDSTIPQPASIVWFRRKYGYLK